MEDLITTFQDLAVGLFAGMSTLAIILLAVFCGLLALFSAAFWRCCLSISSASTLRIVWR